MLKKTLLLWLIGWYLYSEYKKIQIVLNQQKTIKEQEDAFNLIIYWRYPKKNLNPDFQILNKINKLNKEIVKKYDYNKVFYCNSFMETIWYKIALNKWLVIINYDHNHDDDKRNLEQTIEDIYSLLKNNTDILLKIDYNLNLRENYIDIRIKQRSEIININWRVVLVYIKSFLKQWQKK